MPENRRPVPAASTPTSPYEYPADLARYVVEHWTDPDHPAADVVPDVSTLKHLFSACYQASLMREEERAVTFRAILAPAELFPAEGLPPENIQRLEFARRFRFDAAELRRLSVAVDTHRTLIGVSAQKDGVLSIWGVVNSGTGWLRDVQGGRGAGAPLPVVPIVHIDAPGSIAAYKGARLIARLLSGRVHGLRADPFTSEWLPRQFEEFRDTLLERHQQAAQQQRVISGAESADLQPTLLREVSERMMKRVIALLRQARHGGTIIFVPTEAATTLSNPDPIIDVKYQFAEAPTRHAFPDLVVRILNRLATIHSRESVGWREFEASSDHQLLTLDDALFETAHVIAGFASADGAVVMDKQHDLLGFGGMISGRLPPVRTVARALDLEGDRVAMEDVENVGTRHRSAYRLAGAVAGAVVIVISQDGGVRFVAQKDGRVTYWELE
jgi:hypothetical protein